ncbi:MAG: sensor histidine kinase [Patescibacteria group bacterium]
MKTTYWYWFWRTFLGPSRLRRKFVRTFLFAGLIPLILMGIVSIYLVNLTHRIDVAEIEKNVATQVATDITRIFQETVLLLDFAVNFDEFAPIATNEQGFFLQEILDRNSSLVEVSLACVIPESPEGRSFCRFGEETSRWMREGANLVPSPELRDQSENPGFFDARLGERYTGPIVFEKPFPHFTVAAPVTNRLGKTIGVLLGKMSLETLQSIVSERRLGETGYAYLTDENGKILSYPDPTFIGAAGKELLPIKKIIQETDEDLRGSQRGRSYVNLAGEQVTGTAVRIPDLGWLAVAEWPLTETEALIQTILVQIGIFALLAFIVIAVIATWVALRLIEPIAALRQGTSVIGGGNFNYRVNIKTGDELEDLGANLNKMAENLKGLEEVRELRLRTDLLAESLRKEQELSKLKDQFITTVSHQFNTPLSVIKWALASLEGKSVKREEIDEATRVIGKSQRDIVAIVNDLVTLSQIGFEYQKTNVKPVDIKHLIEKSLDYLAEIVKGKKLAIEIKETGASTVAPMNEFTMAKAMENLIDNAVAYSNDGGKIAIEIGGSNKELTLTITDQGIGIPVEDQSSIFQQFFRAKNAIQKKNVGTGLGLFIAKTIVEGHNGKISFRSSENKGSSFTIAIPR